MVNDLCHSFIHHGNELEIKCCTTKLGGLYVNKIVGCELSS